MLPWLGLLSLLGVGCSGEPIDEEDPSPEVTASPTPTMAPTPTQVPTPTMAPTPPTDTDQDGYPLAADCDDLNPAVHPMAAELCDGIDNDCDTFIDEEVMPTWYADSDKDTYGSNADTISACARPSGYVSSSGDCDDSNALVHPGAGESCDGTDNDCDSKIDENVTMTFYLDGDGDSYGDALQTTEACTAPDGYVSDAFDCDDASPDTYPAANELCDDLDNDCDEEVDEGIFRSFYLDGDGDGFGDETSMEVDCALPEGYSRLPGDCNDADAGQGPTLVQLGGGNQADGSVTNPYGTIQAAVDAFAANPNPCDTILVDEGFYPEAVRLEGQSGLTLRAAMGPELTGIQPRNRGERPVKIASSEGVILQGFDITGAGGPVSGSGGGISIESSKDIRITSCNFHDLEATESNTSYGGGIAVVTSAGVVVSESSFLRNKADYGGAIGLDGGGEVSIENCLFSGNSASDNGGALSLSVWQGGGAKAWVKGSRFEGNSAAEEGGALHNYAYLGLVLEVEDSVFVSNTAGQNAGAIYNAGRVERCQLWDNQASDGVGGGLVLDIGGVVRNSILGKNLSRLGGGGIAVRHLSLIDNAQKVLENLTLVENQTSSLKGASIYLELPEKSDSAVLVNLIVFGGVGSGVFADQGSKAPITVSHCDVFGQTVSAYGGKLSDIELVGVNGNLKADPLFVLWPTASPEEANLHLQAGSVCLDSGDSTVGLDADGSSPDIGAFGGPKSDWY